MTTEAAEHMGEVTPDPTTEEVKKELLSKYPTKVARKRAKQIVVNQVDPDSCVPEIQSNVRTVPGIITQRGCTYAGCKGVVLGPTRDIVNITHGPIGCGFYSWLTRRNQTKPEGPEDHNFMPYCFSTDMGARKSCARPFRRPMTSSSPRPLRFSPPAPWVSSVMMCTP